MSFRLWQFSLCAFMVLLCPLLSAAADLESAKRAYQQEDYTTALKELTPLAAQGDANAQLFLAKMNWMGQGVLKDSDQAVKWFKLSGAQGNAEAQFYLGSFYLLPHRDIGEGVKWLRLSAEQGNQDAQWLLGKAYLQGDKELPRDPVQAAMWLSLAAKGNLDFYESALRAAQRQIAPDQVAKGKALAAAWKPKPGLRPEEESAHKDKGTAENRSLKAGTLRPPFEN